MSFFHVEYIGLTNVFQTGINYSTAFVVSLIFNKVCLHAEQNISPRRIY